MPNIYFSVDIETNGLAAGHNSMIQLGCAAIDMDTAELVGTFKRSLFPLSDMKVDKSTMEFWEKFPDTYQKIVATMEDPAIVIKDFDTWVRAFGIQYPVGAAWKPGFDMAFLRYYLYRFCDGDVFGRAGSGLDIKTLTAIALNQPFTETQIAKVPSSLKGTTDEHSHDALADAIEQANVMYNAMRKLGVNV